MGRRIQGLPMICEFVGPSLCRSSARCRLYFCWSLSSRATRVLRSSNLLISLIFNTAHAILDFMKSMDLTCRNTARFSACRDRSNDLLLSHLRVYSGTKVRPPVPFHADEHRRRWKPKPLARHRGGRGWCSTSTWFFFFSSGPVPRPRPEREFLRGW